MIYFMISLLALWEAHALPRALHRGLRTPVALNTATPSRVVDPIHICQGESVSSKKVSMSCFLRWFFGKLEVGKYWTQSCGCQHDIFFKKKKRQSSFKNLEVKMGKVHHTEPRTCFLGSVPVHIGATKNTISPPSGSRCWQSWHWRHWRIVLTS